MPGQSTLDINDGAQVVGADPNSSGGFLYLNGVFTPINVPGSTGTVPTGINNAGQIVGSYWDVQGKMHGFLDTDGVFTTIDTPYASEVSAPLGNTQLFGINDTGDIVGTGPFPPTPEPAPALSVFLGLGAVVWFAFKARRGIRELR